MNNKPRQYTREEVQELFIRHCWALVDYWASIPDKTTKERLEGLMFSTLATLDGASPEVPAFNVTPDPHPDDLDYHKENGENWFPENPISPKCDISGGLHESFAKGPR